MLVHLLAPMQSGHFVGQPVVSCHSSSLAEFLRCHWRSNPPAKIKTSLKCNSIGCTLLGKCFFKFLRNNRRWSPSWAHWHRHLNIQPPKWWIFYRMSSRQRWCRVSPVMRKQKLCFIHFHQWARELVNLLCTYSEQRPSHLASRELWCTLECDICRLVFCDTKI